VPEPVPPSAAEPEEELEPSDWDTPVVVPTKKAALVPSTGAAVPIASKASIAAKTSVNTRTTAVAPPKKKALSFDFDVCDVLPFLLFSLYDAVPATPQPYFTYVSCFLLYVTTVEITWFPPDVPVRSK
jgi:hypothetical protein